jgi:hypothetical protein
VVIPAETGAILVRVFEIFIKAALPDNIFIPEKINRRGSTGITYRKNKKQGDNVLF